MGSYSASAQHLVDKMRALALAEPARGLAFQGAPGANSDLAAREYDPNSLPLPCYAFEDAIDAVREGLVDRAIIPIENSLHGRVADIHFLLPESGLSIVGEHFLPIRYGLMSRNLGPVTRAMSHEQALGQCRKWLRANNIAPVAHSDTAGAAAWVADSDEVGLAALAPPHAADLYGLTLHGTGMEDADHNMTRFVVLAREPLRDLSAVEGPVMTTFMFEVKNIPAALYKALGGFATNGVNMTKLESYQTGGSFAATKFYADIVGAPGDERVDRALEELDFQTKSLRLLGTYPQARPRP
ncbi:prephenate dehydratase [Sphingopyxis alaskensis]|jgi:prephenate dehydratase|uniref:prephenate dehydratase n=1 Tax=Sphingopyxis alaskensis (strain DSM 13593 / LMG 18877 / RB2256) TaxID=317655 RepID=Q1GVH9_SPHAL|nr:prephenate dehydratase [Sphingopyxis alaskensis]ABF52343.1 prephenate dehydratase [Sphingopyxis alaskensis RB2256]MCM3420381.1 prephenate dehydratase [Sphingopyxis alaskensis]